MKVNFRHKRVNENILKYLTYSSLFVVTLWTLFVAASLAWNLYRQKSETDAVARATAMSSYEKDEIYRQWNIVHGGAYVAVPNDSSIVHPNDLQDSLILATSGLKLVRLSHAAMVNEAYDLAEVSRGMRGHITSLSTTHPAFQPDAWEKRALQAFEQGVEEYATTAKINGQFYYRFMRPLKSEDRCLPCHADSDISENDILGGLSVSTPLAIINQAGGNHTFANWLGYSFLWLVGLCIIFWTRYQRHSKMLALQQSESTFRTLSESAPVGIFQTDAEGKYIYVNQRWSEITGLSAKDAMGDGWSKALHPQDRDKIFAAWQQAVTQSGLFKEEYRFQKNNGEINWVAGNSTILRNEKGETLGVLGTISDITALKRTQEKLQIQITHFEHLFENSPEAIVLLSQDDRVLRINKEFTKLFGYLPEEAENRCIDELIVPSELSTEADTLTQKVIGQKNVHIETVRRHKNGQLIEVLILGTPIYIDGNQIGIYGIYQDITERKKWEKALQESNEKFRTISASAQDAFLMIDDQGNLTFWNAAAEKMFGYSEVEALGQNAHLLIVPERFHEAHFKAFKKFQHTGEGAAIGQTLELMALHKKGFEFPVELSLSAIPIQGKWHAIGIIRDITERKKNEEQLRQLSQVVQQSPSSVVITDQDGTIQYVNPKFTETTGYSEEEVLGKNPRLLKSGKQGQEFYAQLWQTINAGEEWRGEICNRKKNGELIWEQVAISAIRNADDEITHFVGLKENITELKMAQIAIQENRRQLQAIMDNTPSAICLKDRQGRYLLVNRSFEKLFSLEKDAFYGKTDFELLPPEIAEKFHADDQTVLKTEKTLELEEELKHDKTRLTYLTVKFPIFDIHGKLTGVCGISTDISKIKMAEKSLQKAKKAAEEANRAKSEFLANMSHEIRTPLNAIIGMTELALDTDLNSEQRGYLNVVESASEGLLVLINDILDFSKIEAGQLVLENIDYKLREVVEGAVEIFSVRAAAKNIELLGYVEPGIPPILTGDPTRLRQILVNLLGNALKFTEKGEVAVKVESVTGNGHRATNQVKLHFQVSDSGIGIASQNLKKIFEKFRQADNSTTRKFGGTGLGLNICKSLVEMMGGRLWVTSQVDKGSTFHFEITAAIGKSGTSKAEFSYPNFNQTHILVVDDNETNRIILKKTLTAWGFHVREAQSGQQALAMLQAAKPEYHLAILDQQMPGMDGMEVAQKIRQNPRYRQLKIIMLSSIGRIQSKFINENQIAHFIAKPVKQSKLFDILVKTLRYEKSRKSAQNTEKTTIARTTFKKYKRILVVEDNLDNQVLIEKVLQKAGYDVGIAENGQAAVEAVKQFRYDLILMDIFMPKMDGFEATHHIRAWEKSNDLNHTPIVALTAHALEGYEKKCLQNDMDDYITKPIKKKILFETIDKWIDTRLTILVVEDNPDNLNLLKNYFKNVSKYQALFAENGKEALAIAQRQPLALILMDMEMPVMNGYEATKAIRQLERGRKIKIIALTAHQGKTETDKCLQAGCDDYLSKPIRKQHLFSKINQYLHFPQETEVRILQTT
ncbi:MAG: PAS domain S-box protein [bacterium]